VKKKPVVEETEEDCEEEEEEEEEYDDEEGGGAEDWVEDDEEEETKPKFKAEYVALNPFKDLYKLSPVIQMAFEFGQACIPLNAAGMILNYAGNHLLHFIATVLHKKVFFPMTRVTSVTLMNNGDIVTTALRRNVEIKPFTND
jgi:hypothetical protein